jgi:hypothetical protein
VSPFFKYNSGYAVAASIDPGLGYWVKTSQDGSFFMHVTGPAGKQQTLRPQASGLSVENLNTLTIQDPNGGSQTLYFGADANGEIPVAMFAMPPVPPAGSFDARFESVDGGTMVQTHLEEVSDEIEFPITVQASAYPLTVTWKMRGSDAYELRAGEHVVQTLSGEGTLRISDKTVNRLRLRVTVAGDAMPTEYSLRQNYPNPFNPSTKIVYGVPGWSTREFIELRVFDILGREVATLVNDLKTPGEYSITWDASGFASGVYLCQLRAGSFVQTRKLVLLR